MNVDDKGNREKGGGVERGTQPASGSSETDPNNSRGKDNSFVRNGQIHFDYKNPTSTITVGVVAFFVFAFTLGVAGYIYGTSSVKKISQESVMDAPYNRKITLREKIEDMDDILFDVKSKTKTCEEFIAKVGDLKDYLDAPTKSQIEKAKKGHR